MGGAAFDLPQSAYAYADKYLEFFFHCHQKKHKKLGVYSYSEQRKNYYRSASKRDREFKLVLNHLVQVRSPGLIIWIFQQYILYVFQTSLEFAMIFLKAMEKLKALLEIKPARTF